MKPKQHQTRRTSPYLRKALKQKKYMFGLLLRLERPKKLPGGKPVKARVGAMLPKFSGLFLFDHTEKLHVASCGEEWTAGRHVIERARKAQGLPSPKSH